MKELASNLVVKREENERASGIADQQNRIIAEANRALCPVETDCYDE